MVVGVLQMQAIIIEEMEQSTPPKKGVFVGSEK